MQHDSREQALRTLAGTRQMRVYFQGLKEREHQQRKAFEATLRKELRLWECAQLGTTPQAPPLHESRESERLAHDAGHAASSGGCAGRHASADAETPKHDSSSLEELQQLVKAEALQLEEAKVAYNDELHMREAAERQFQDARDRRVSAQADAAARAPIASVAAPTATTQAPAPSAQADAPLPATPPRAVGKPSADSLAPPVCTPQLSAHGTSQLPDAPGGERGRSSRPAPQPPAPVSADGWVVIGLAMDGSTQGSARGPEQPVAAAAAALPPAHGHTGLAPGGDAAAQAPAAADRCTFIDLSGVDSDSEDAAAPPPHAAGAQASAAAAAATTALPGPPVHAVNATRSPGAPPAASPPPGPAARPCSLCELCKAAFDESAFVNELGQRSKYCNRGCRSFCRRASGHRNGRCRNLQEFINCLLDMNEAQCNDALEYQSVGLWGVASPAMFDLPAGGVGTVGQRLAAKRGTSAAGDARLAAPAEQPAPQQPPPPQQPPAQQPPATRKCSLCERFWPRSKRYFRYETGAPYCLPSCYEYYRQGYSVLELRKHMNAPLVRFARFVSKACSQIETEFGLRAAPDTHSSLSLVQRLAAQGLGAGGPAAAAPAATAPAATAPAADPQPPRKRVGVPAAGPPPKRLEGAQGETEARADRAQSNMSAPKKCALCERMLTRGHFAPAGTCSYCRPACAKYMSGRTAVLLREAMQKWPLADFAAVVDRSQAAVEADFGLQPGDGAATLFERLHRPTLPESQQPNGAAAPLVKAERL